MASGATKSDLYVALLPFKIDSSKPALEGLCLNGGASIARLQIWSMAARFAHIWSNLTMRMRLGRSARASVLLQVIFQVSFGTSDLDTG